MAKRWRHVSRGTPASQGDPPPGSAEDLAAHPWKHRDAFLAAVGALDEEGFDYIAWGIYQTSKTAGGFNDKTGWVRVREAALQLPSIAALEQKFEDKKKALDDG